MRRLRWFALLMVAAIVLATGCKSKAPEESTMDDPSGVEAERQVRRQQAPAAMMQVGRASWRARG